MANKSVYCSTTSKSYTTDETGKIGEIIYVPTITTLQFELTNQPWADGTYHLNWTVSGGEDSATNVASSTASKTYDGCAYTITFRNYDNNLCVNNSVYCTTNGKTYQTNASGQTSFITSQSSLSFRITSGVQDTSDNSGIQMLNTYDIVCSTTGISGQLIGRSLTGSKSLTSSTPVKINQNVPTVGDIMTIGTRQYIVAKDDGTTVLVMLRYWEEDTPFNTTERASYSGSDIEAKCVTWYNSQVPDIWKTANVFNAIEVDYANVTATCFIPNHIQAHHYIFYDNSNKAHEYWTSSAVFYGGDFVIYRINDSGNVYSSKAEYGYQPSGFRPALALKRSMFLNG